VLLGIAERWREWRGRHGVTRQLGQVASGAGGAVQLDGGRRGECTWEQGLACVGGPGSRGEWDRGWSASSRERRAAQRAARITWGRARWQQASGDGGRVKHVRRAAWAGARAGGRGVARASRLGAPSAAFVRARGQAGSGARAHRDGERPG